MTTNLAILLVEDNEDDVFLMKRALQEAAITNPILFIEDGQQAMDYLAGKDHFADRARYPIPAVVFLDLKLPLKSGHEVLSWIRLQPVFASLVIVILTCSNSPADMTKSYQLGANSYLVKPPTSGQLLDLARSSNWGWLRSDQLGGPETGSRA